MTILELQRKVYNDVKAKSVNALTNDIFENNVVKVETIIDLDQKVDLRMSATGVISIGSKKGINPYKPSASLLSMIPGIKTNCKTKEAKDDASDSELVNDFDLDYVLSSIPTEVFAEADSEIVIITRQIDSRTTYNTTLHDMPQESIGSAIACLFQSDDDLVDTVQTDIEQSMEDIVLVNQDV